MTFSQCTKDLLETHLEMDGKESREYFKRYCLTRFKLGVKAKTVFVELCDAHPNNHPGKTSVYDWMHQFASGDFSVIDAPRPGRPLSATDANHVDVVNSLICENPHLSTRQIEAMTGISQMSHRTTR